MLALRNISKSFPGVKALSDVSLFFQRGEVHAICGENGAGKSTLMNIIAGNIQPDNGEIIIDKQKIIIRNPAAALSLKIAIVHQEKSLVESLSIAENIFVHLPVNSSGLISYSILYKETRELLDKLGLHHISPRTKIEKLSSPEKQLIEIAKAIARHPAYLILDEPTAALTQTETDLLFSILHRLKKDGTAIIYISHRMQEIARIADTVSILKDGCFQGSFFMTEITIPEIVRKMIGRELQQATFRSHRQEEIVFEVKELSGKCFQHINFVLHKGEVLGISGLTGSGRTELALALFGYEQPQAGQIIKDHEDLKLQHPSDAVSHHIAYIPEERKTEALFMESDISDNIISSGLNTGWYKKNKNVSLSEQFIKKLGIKVASARDRVQQLSGGNQQKVVFAKWLNTQPDIFIINEPTKGVDVGARQEIYKQLQNITAAGKSVILISSDLPELLLLSDRIAVMYKGMIRGITARDMATEENITSLASGI